MTRSLSEGSVINFICKGKIPPSGQSTFQVLATKKIQTKEENQNTSDYTKYRLCFSDGDHRYSQAVLLIDNLDDVPPDFSIIEIDPKHHKNSIKNVNNKLIFVVGAFKVVEIAEFQIGNPVTVPPEAFETGNHNQNGNGTSSEPVTPTNAPSTSSHNFGPPSLPYKRPHGEEDNSNSSSEENKAKLARRNLFPSKTTHCIKDLNPYQNKYTIQARVIKKSTIKSWNNSRGEGTVFDFTLKDASGDIKVTAFKELATKFFDVIEEGKVYYLSNAQIKPVRSPQYNFTTHNYELTLLNHSVIEVEANSNRTNDVPTIEYNFVKVQDIINVSSDDKIDVLVVCSHVGSCVNQTTRAGRETKKREIQVTDESKSEIQLTFWGDKAEKYDESSLLGKVLAVKSVAVSDWNGKSLNCTFGSSLEIDPMNIPGAKDLKDFYHSLSSNRDQFQSLTSNDRSAMRPQSQQSDSFVTLKQIHDDFKDASNNHTTSKYYNVCAYVTMIKADKIMYKACPTEKCNKSVVDEGNGNYRCEKCAQSFNNFGWRYILRVAIADSTDYEWITMFDEMAAKIIGKSASDMAKIKEQDERNFLKILNSSKYRQFNFSIKTALESWNDENRLRINVMNLELVNYQDPKHIQRLKAEIEALQC